MGGKIIGNLDINGQLSQNNKKVITTDGGTLTGLLNSPNNNFIRGGNEFNFANQSTTNVHLNYRAGNGDKTSSAITGYYFRDGQRSGYADIFGKNIEANGLLKSTSNGNTVSIGSQNSSCCHIYNSANIPFYFNKEIFVNGNKVLTYDGAWQNANLTSSFTKYSTNSVIRYKKYGKVVSVQGEIKPTSAITGSSSPVLIFTLPAGYRPSASLQYVCQGSGSNQWLCTVEASGEVKFARYNNGTGFVSASTSAWLPFNFTFLID